MKSDGNIVPPSAITVSTRTLAEAGVAVLCVEPADSPPVRHRCRICVRVGPRRGFATAQDERVLTEKRLHRDAPYDLKPITAATLADLNRRTFEENYLPAAIAPEALEANDRTYEQRLAASKMVASAAEPIPTVLGLLVLSDRPRDFLAGAYVQFLRIAGTDLSDPITDELVVDGPIVPLLLRLDDKLIAHNHVAIDYTSSTLEQRRWTIRSPRYNNSGETRSCTGRTKEPTRPFTSIGSTTASVFATRVALMGSSRQRRSASPASGITGIRTSPKRCGSSASSNVSARPSPP